MENTHAATPGCKVLVVDDEEAIRRSHERILKAAGYLVETASDGIEARARAEHGGYDVIVSDISMPGLDGVGLLRAVRATDLDVPVIFVTGSPAVDTAIQAVQLGALDYLVKPITSGALLDAVANATRLHRLARFKRDAAAHLGAVERQIGDRAGVEATLDRALEGLWMAFQPIVSLADRRVHGYEALLRSTEPLLPHPGAVLEAAERVGRLHDLGRTIRARVASVIADAPPEPAFFVNLHPHDLTDEELLSPDAPLSRHAQRVVLELTERASLERIVGVPSRVAALRRLGYRIAIDDLGAGYAGLSAFAELRPEVVKLDMSLVRDIHVDTVKQKLVRSMISVCREMELSIVAEGVETAEERDALLGLGADLLQGYLFAKPARPYPDVKW